MIKVILRALLSLSAYGDPHLSQQRVSDQAHGSFADGAGQEMVLWEEISGYG